MMPEQFYRDRGNEQVAHLAKAICKQRGCDPYQLVEDNGYPNAPMIPIWWKYQDAAQSFLACYNALAGMPETPEGE